MAIELWTSNELYALLRDERLDPIPSYILDTYFGETYYSDDREILLAKLPKAYRRLAPFVLPAEQGKPIFTRGGESVKSLTPAYIKPKDAVRPEDARNVLPSEVFRNGGQRPSIAQRFDQRVVEVTEFHRRAIRMQEAWMAARAFFDGKVSIRYERDSGMPHPEVIVDFGRDAGHTITLAPGTTWDDPDADILGNLETWMNTQYLANGGGSASMLMVGAKVAPLLRRNNKIKAMLDTRYRGAEDIQISTGILRTQQPLNRIGQLTTGLEIWSYKDQVENNDGSLVDLFDPRDVCLISPGATGVRAYGAIYDVDAIQGGSVAVDIFPKMFKTDDPGELYIMHQSAPLPIPLYPNRTLKARVLTN